MEAAVHAFERDAPGAFATVRSSQAAAGRGGGQVTHVPRISSVLEAWFERVAPCPWAAHAGLSPWSGQHALPAAGGAATAFSTRMSKKRREPLYTPEERVRRDASPWTRVQAILAPLQFAIFAVSLVLVLRYLETGRGYGIATASILLKTVALYAIMVTGSIWEKRVFGRWLFARAFFWEDVFSFAVLGLQTAYLASLVFGWGSPRQQMMVAVAAYATYAINAAQFLLKLRAARLETPAGSSAAAHRTAATA